MAAEYDIARFNLQLPSPLKRALEEEAAQQGRSLATLVRVALEEYLRRQRDRSFVAEMQASYEAIREEDLRLVEAAEGSELPRRER